MAGRNLMDEYQLMAHITAVYPPEHTQAYLALGLGNEAGEVQGVIKKFLRGDYGTGAAAQQKARELIGPELGDVLWYLSENARLWGFKLSEIAEMNLSKLSSRAQRNQLQGDGGDR
jgi:NTP pyrophosphatase (non-canonical NTP hydrolase)